MSLRKIAQRPEDKRASDALQQVKICSQSTAQLTSGEVRSTGMHNVHGPAQSTGAVDRLAHMDFLLAMVGRPEERVGRPWRIYFS